MRVLLRRAVVCILLVAAVAGNTAICAGWTSTPEGRMACCETEANCPMHQDSANGPHAASTIDQARADTCCALSEQRGSTPSPQPFAPAQPDMTSAVVATLVASPSSAGATHVAADAPLDSPPVARHLLLSVFLV